jgi:glycosyltransferase involved in cell wall biosynthesis
MSEILTMPVEVKPMKIAFFAGTMKPGQDGVTRVLYRWIEGLRERGVDQMFFSPIVPAGTHQPVPMVRVPSVTFPWYRDYRVAMPGTRHFEDALRTFAPDVIHINSPCSLGYAAVQFARRNKIPVVATYHTHFPRYARYYRVTAFENLMWAYLRKLYNLCDRLYVPSQPILQELSLQRIRPLEFLPHGVDTVEFNPHHRSDAWRRENGLAGKHVLLYVGRLVAEKDLDTLVEAYRSLRRSRSDIALVLVGEGPMRNALRAMAPDIILLGYRSGIELSRIYASSDLFVFPSTTETFGNVILEAMASGLVPVCADAGGSRGNITPWVTGVLARPRDIRDFAGGIAAIIDDPRKRTEVSEQALVYARRQSWDAVIGRLHTSYARVIAEARAATTRRAA